MFLTLCEDDLRSRYRNVTGEMIKFKHFKTKAQKVVLLVGEGLFERAGKAAYLIESPRRVLRKKGG